MAGVAYSEPRPASLQYPTNVLAFSESALTVSSYVKMIEEDEGEALVVPKEDSLDNLLSVNSWKISHSMSWGSPCRRSKMDSSQV